MARPFLLMHAEGLILRLRVPSSADLVLCSVMVSVPDQEQIASSIAFVDGGSERIYARV